MQETEKTLRQRLNETFGRYHYVGIRNILRGTFKWTVALEQHEILNMSQADVLSEEQMANIKGGAFLPNDSSTKQQAKLTTFELAPGEKKMVPGEAAYVLVTRMYRKAMREKYGTDKTGLAKMAVPFYMDEMLPKIIVGPIVKNVGEVMNTFAQSLDEQLSNTGFSDVQAFKPAGEKDAKKPKQ